MSDAPQTTPRQDALADALALCERIEAQYQREADDARSRCERAVSPLLIKSGATQCVNAIRAMMEAAGG